jgi:hypothetical protein
MDKIRIHIGLTAALQQQLVKGGKRAIEKFAKSHGIEDLNLVQLERFGILTGSIGSGDETRVRDADGVEFIEADGLKTAQV